MLKCCAGNAGAHQGNTHVLVTIFAAGLSTFGPHSLARWGAKCRSKPTQQGQLCNSYFIEPLGANKVAVAELSSCVGLYLDVAPRRAQEWGSKVDIPAANIPTVLFHWSMRYAFVQVEGRNTLKTNCLQRAPRKGWNQKNKINLQGEQLLSWNGPWNPYSQPYLCQTPR